MSRQALNPNANDAPPVTPIDRPAAALQPVPAKLKLAPAFTPCPIETDDEMFRNGIFEFNITRLMAFVVAHPERFPIESVAVSSIPHYGDSGLNASTIATADLGRPVLFAEIAPGRFDLIDGHHRAARARALGVPTVPAYQIHGPHHVAFLTSVMAYQKYVEYWNGKIEEMRPKRRRSSSNARAAL